MLKPIATLFFVLFAGQASAQNCPDFYRFVDFGIESNDGIMHRGGPVFRAEGFDGQLLLLEPRTECLPVRDVSKDGHGNPIPVVTSIDYDPAKTSVVLTGLRVAAVETAQETANNNAKAHRARLERAGAKLTRGDSFLCVDHADEAAVSCQLVSPYPGNAALVVYCDGKLCTMPSMVVDEKIVIAANWASEPSFLALEAQIGPAILEKIGEIRDFINPLSASLSLR